MDKQHEKNLREYEAIQEELSKTSEPRKLKELGKKLAGMEELVSKIRELQGLELELRDNENLLQEKDEELRTAAAEEISALKPKILGLRSSIQTLLLPRDPLDEKNAILEIRAGTGGDEAALFAAELFRMYQKYADAQKWKTSLISSNHTGIGGYKEIIFEIRGRGVYGKLKYESGVHRVQRVPDTEKSGRVHTSTVTVAVLPEIEEVDMEIDPKDLKIEASTSSGAGGQSVNTTYSAIKITHLPTGITAQSQDERSQTQNKEKALQVIRARVYEYQEQKKQKELREKRRSMIGTGDRSEKIRTYNFPQDRVTDHRINQNFGQINLILGGKIEPIIDAVIKTDQELQLAAKNKF